MADTIQACRNAWTCCGLQALLGQPMELTPSILAYSLLYPTATTILTSPVCRPTTNSNSVSDSVSAFVASRSCLPIREAAIWTMVQLIEDQYPRLRHTRRSSIVFGHSSRAGAEYRATERATGSKL
jgi:hypothetical protein